MFAILFLLALVGFVIWRSWNRADEDVAGEISLKWGVTLVVILMIGFELIPMFKMGGISAASALPVFALGMFVLTKLWLPNVLSWMVSPFTSAFDGGSAEVEARPQLSSARAKRMQGRYDEALQDVQQQLEQFPNDFECQLLMAELLIECKQEFDAGMAVLEAVTTQPHEPKQIASALNLIADMQIKHRSNPDAARAALQRIVDANADDVLATKAAQRITHLPSREMLDDRSRPKLHTVEHVEDYIKPGGVKTQIGIAKEDSADERAQALGERIRQFPQDTEAREQLALLYADEYGQLDWAADQIEGLIRMPHQPEREMVRWLELLAGIYRRHNDIHGACRAYQRIIDSYPRNPGADRARGQLAIIGVPPA